jgi:prepilin-type processing-associated H-X9-DG protein
VKSCGQLADLMCAKAFHFSFNRFGYTRYTVDTWGLVCGFNVRDMRGWDPGSIASCSTTAYSASAIFQPWTWPDEFNNPLPASYNQLKEGIERFFITDINNPAASSQAQSTLPVMFDSFGINNSSYSVSWTDNTDRSAVVRFNHVPGGCNVLFMDGHVEFQRYGQNFPIGWNGSPWNAGSILPEIVSQASGFGS